MSNAKQANKPKNFVKPALADKTIIKATGAEALKAMLRCPGIDTTDQVTGETFRHIIKKALTRLTVN